MKTQWTDKKFKDKYTEKRLGRTSRIFTIGKFKGKNVDWVCYCFPDYIEWCLKNLEGFSLLKEERLSYLCTLENKLKRNPDNEELKFRVMRAELFYTTGKIKLK
jgi:hypothetical protein